MTDFEQKWRDLTRRIIDRVAADPQFREQLVDDPGGALEEAGFNQELRELQETADDIEVAGYAHAFLFQSWGCL